MRLNKVKTLDNIFNSSENNDNCIENDSNASVNTEIGDNGAFSVKNNGRYIHCLTIIGQIEGHNILPPDNKTTKSSM